MQPHRKITRNLKRKMADDHDVRACSSSLQLQIRGAVLCWLECLCWFQEHEEFDPKDLKEHEEATKVKNINKIELGRCVVVCVSGNRLCDRCRWEMDTWYYSPFPEEFRQCEKLWFCEFCLKFMKSATTLARHQVR